jgi:hypothetical protein
MRYSMGALAALLTMGAVGGGCGSSRFGNSVLLANVVDLSSFSDRRYPLTITLVDANDGHCPLSQSAILTVGDQSWPFASCSSETIDLTQNTQISIEILDGADKADAVIAGMAPGMDATIVAPASGTTTPSGSVSVSLPAALQGLKPFSADFVYQGTDDATYPGDITNQGTATPDTVTVQAPEHSGPFTLWVSMTSPDSQEPVPVSGTVASCSGFSKCVTNPVTTLGPLPVTVGS